MILRRQSLIRPGVIVAIGRGARRRACPLRRRSRHDIPSSVTVLAFVRPEAHQLHVVIRVPLESMRDVNFPVRGPGYLDLRAGNAPLA